MPVAHEGIYLGFDPGGDHKFGVAVIEGNCVRTSTVSSVDEAMKWAAGACEARQPIAAGIDTLLHWATSEGGTRPCDSQLRIRYPAVKNSVMSPNSLYGAMAIGGMALALRLRQRWPELVLNETHPKVLLHELGKPYDAKRSETVETVIDWFVSQGHYTGSIKGEHELDAALSAWATKKGVAETSSERWVDIIGNGGNLLFPAGKVRYLWPEALKRSVHPLMACSSE
jgi:putative cofactor-binding repeat protein